MSEKKSIYQKYFEEQERYVERHGEKTVVFFQMGKFYDAYSDARRGYQRLEDLGILLNIHYIRRPPGPNNPKKIPNQFGINCVSIRKHLTTMVENGYTVVIFDQKVEDDNSIERVWAGTYSAGTIISDRQNHNANHMISVYLAEEKQLKGPAVLMAIGVTIIDITTGNSMVHEFYSTPLDENYGLDELVRIIQIFRPSELVVYYHPLVPSPEKSKALSDYLEMSRYPRHRFHVYQSDKENDDALQLLTRESFRIGAQNDLLAEVFDLSHQVSLGNSQSALEILGIEQKPYVVISFMIVVRYISLHNPLLLKNLSHPDIYIYDQHLILGNNAIEQLNVVDNNSLELYNRRYRSVFHVVNRTSTPMGRRFLMESLLNPLSQEKKVEIHRRYQMIGELLADKHYELFRSELKKIQDMERLHRLMGMGSISPVQFYRLTSYYRAASLIIGHLREKSSLSDLVKELGRIDKRGRSQVVKDFNTYQLQYAKEFDLEALPLFGCEGSKPIFQEGIYPRLDKIQTAISTAKELIHTLQDELTRLVGTESKGKKRVVEVESNERDGQYFTVTKTGEKAILVQLKKKPIRFKLHGTAYQFGTDEMEFRSLPKGRTKIFVACISDHTTKLQRLENKLDKLTKKCFLSTMQEYYSNYQNTLHLITRLIALTDFLVSGAVVADEYYYCRPEMNMNSDPNKRDGVESLVRTVNESYLAAEGLRHCIIERLCEETSYIPNNISLGNCPPDMMESDSSGLNGILLYGINSSGKTALIKSIGIAIILAQIGYYVPTSRFRYEPYMSLYARITGNDNIFKGLSSFALEMTELNAILVRTDEHGAQTLVIGDEVCRGTEDISGLALVSSALVSLSNSKTSYIFATHLHDLPTIPEVRELPNLRLFHLRVEYDEKHDCLVFDRKLTLGSGPRVYGLTVAKHMIKSAPFVARAEIVRKRLMREGITDIPTRKSKYNGKLIVKKCAVCGYRPTKDHHKELETHHINFQSNCDADGKVLKEKHLTKNELYNLVVLCRGCHNRVHQNDLIIEGYVRSSEGPLLIFHDNIQKCLDENMKEFLRITKTHSKKTPHRVKAYSSSM